ncbi:hypothetical protein BX616_011014 [Lobosporangium transversale]|nr:hypothetical protein BX616_011014 [Lobosporangium transversale]
MSLKDENRSEKRVRFPRLQEFELWGSRTTEQWLDLELLIGQCPVLRKLNWDSTWPELVWIRVKKDRTRFTDDLYVSILQAAKRPLDRLEMDITGHRTDTFNLLRTHFETIQTISLKCCSDNTGDWIIEVLTSCPALECFNGMSITAKQIIESKPWVCHRLQKLSLFIDMGFEDNALTRRWTIDELEQCRKVFGLLAALKNLQILDFLGSFSTTCGYSFSSRCGYSSLPHNAPTNSRFRLVPLPLRLKAGLGLLAGLTKLEQVRFWGQQQRVHMEELIWMKLHWANLKTLAGGWSVQTGGAQKSANRYFREGLLREWLIKHGISTSGSYYVYEYHGNFSSHDVDWCEGSDSEETSHDN